MPTLGEVAQLVTACALAYNIWQTWRNGRQSAKIAADVEVIHKATNSLTDKLVIKTDRAARAEGTAAGIVEGRADGLDQGRKEERPIPNTPG